MKEKKVKRFLAIVILMFIGILYINGSFEAKSMAVKNTVINEKPSFVLNNDSMNINDSTQLNVDLYNKHRESIRIKLIDEVNNHIRKKFNVHDNKLSTYLVDYSIQYDINLCFMMAQTKLETGFGTMGAGRPTSRYSLFGVNRRYNNYDSAIEDYCILLRKSYLGETKTENDLMKNYVTLSGKRYAANTRYEIELSAEYKKIKNNTQIYELWKELKKNS